MTAVRAVSVGCINDFCAKGCHDRPAYSGARRSLRGGDLGLNLDDSVYNRLLKDRIIFLGSEVNDQVANRICAQLLLLAAEDPERDILLYINSPGGSVYSGMAIYDTMQFVDNDVATVAMGMAASMGQLLLCAGTKGKRVRAAARADHDAPAVRRYRRYGRRHRDPGRADALHQADVPGAGGAPHGPAGRSRSRPTPTVTAGSPPRRRMDYGFIDKVITGARQVPEGAGTRELRSHLDLTMPAQPLHPSVASSSARRTGSRSPNPYNKMFEERIIFLGVQIDDASANDVMAQLLTLESNDPDRDITMYINSPGGSFTAMTAIYDTMQFVRPDIPTVCLGQAASAAAVLLAAGTPGKRMALPHSRIIIHQPATEGGYGQGSDIEIQAREMMRMRTHAGGADLPATARSRSRRSRRTSTATRS